MPEQVEGLLKSTYIQKDRTIPVLLFFGPTGSGKTELLKDLFTRYELAYRAEIVSADSMQVYRGMDIGTAKPSAELREALPHHLIDIRNPDEQFNAGEFVRLADACCVEITGRGGLPVVSGGTGFYLKNFVLGLPQSPPSDVQIRQELREELRLRGIGSLAAELARCDPESANRIHINDEYRILRALEVFRLLKRPLSSFPSIGSVPKDAADSRPDYRFLIISLERKREELYRRIDARCAQMFRDGLPEEVSRLFEAGYGPDDPGLRAIGYKEFFVEAEAGGYRISEDLIGVETLIARNSRRYAKRQITYFASIPDVTWISASTDPIHQIRSMLDQFCSAGA